MSLGRKPVRRRWVSPVLLAVIVLAVGVASPGDAQPYRAAAASRAAASRPGIPSPRTGTGTTNVIRFDPVTPSVKKAKIQFSLRNLTFAVNLTPCIFSNGFNYPEKCPFYNGRKLPVPESFDSWYAEQALAWVATKNGSSASYGRFAAVRVHALAFGSIPVSATVHLTQTVHNHLYDPLTLLAVVYGTTVQPGRVLYPGYGRAPDNGVDGTNFQLPITLRGHLNVRISDVTVDSVPVSVGSTCRTSKPATVRAVVPGGYSLAVSDPLAHRDRPGGFSPVFLPASAASGGYAGAGWIDGTVNIPPFRGCHNGAENLTPLLTGLVSGPGNPISLLATTILTDCADPSAKCPPRPKATQQAVEALNRSIATRAGITAVKQAAIRVQHLQATATPKR